MASHRRYSESARSSASRFLCVYAQNSENVARESAAIAAVMRQLPFIVTDCGRPIALAIFLE